MLDPSFALASETEKVCAKPSIEPIKIHMTNKKNVGFMKVDLSIINFYYLLEDYRA